MLYRFAKLPDFRSKLARGFTLVELMVAMSIFTIMMLVLTGIINTVYRAWDGGKRSTEMSQNARAILSLIETDLGAATVSPLMQMGQNPTGLTSKLTGGEKDVTNADSLFWWAPIMGAAREGHMAMGQCGWYLVESPSTTGTGIQHNLKRFARKFPLTEPAVTLPSGTKTADSIYWFNILDSTGPGSLKENSRVVSNNVIGLWFECLDRENKVIPPRNPLSPGIRFNSAERFQMASAGVPFEDDTTFRYTDPATTLQANQLPSSVRVSLMLIDDLTLKRHPDLDPLPAFDPDKEAAELIGEYRRTLEAKGIVTFVYTTTVKLINAP